MNTEQPTFKAGDEVYCPSQGTVIHNLADYESETYPLLLTNSNCAASISLKGFKVITDKIPYIFHATPENKALLEALYKCEFESPKLKGSDLTRKLLADGAEGVLCYCSNSSETDATENKRPRVIQCMNRHWFNSVCGTDYTHAVPCNDYANLVDGALTLKEEFK